MMKKIVGYCITGVDRAGIRFKLERLNPAYIACMNVWKGTLWAIKSNGKRQRIKTYNN